MLHLTYELANKTRLITVADPNSQSVSVIVLVKVGSRYEGDSNSGIAHFVEHMFFKGTPLRPSSKAIGMDIENIGGSSNAFTSYNYTGYYIKCPKEAFPKALEILADMMKNGLFEQSEIDKEKGVIIEEIKMYEDRPMNKAVAYWYESFFKNDPLGREITGTIDTVSSFKRDNFIDFVNQYYCLRNIDLQNQYYVGSNIVVAVAGGIDPKLVQEQIEEEFGSIQKGDLSQFINHKQVKQSSTALNLYKPIEQSHLALGCYSVSRKYKKKYVLNVLNAMLSDGFGSRLFQVIRDELGLAYYIYSGLSLFEDTGVFKIGMGVENSKIDMAVDAVLKEVNKVIHGKFDKEELERAKNYLIGNLVTEMETSDDVALWYGTQLLLDNEIKSIEQIKTEIKSVNFDNIVEEGQKVLGGQDLILTAVSPHQTLNAEITKLLKL